MAITLNLRNLLYVIHAIPPERLTPLLPRGIEPDLRDTPLGPRAFLATVTLEAGAAFPYILSGFRQVNYRAYVRHESEPGVLFLRSWVSARAAAAVLSLAISTEHASVDLTIEDGDRPYQHYHVQAHSGDHHLMLEAGAADAVDYSWFGSHDEAVHLLTHRLNGFASAKGGLSVIRVSHAAMNPVPARVTAAAADQWVESGLLKPEEVSHPLLALIQPETQFDMNLPEKIT
ncbi:MAG: DUF2071 domain-containing protein [Terriglobales bacterium]